MELIRKTGLKDIYHEGRNRQCGIFKCSLCGIGVERSLTNGIKTKTCGEHSHKGKGTKIHHVWSCMKQRCLNPNNKKYHRYGGRGISVCSEWTEFPKFKKWVLKNGYKEGLQIDRIDNDGNYEPDNCRFITNAENCRNRSTTKLNWVDVTNMRKSLKQNLLTFKEASVIYGITEAHVCCINSNKTWEV